MHIMPSPIRASQRLLISGSCGQNLHVFGIFCLRTPGETSNKRRHSYQLAFALPCAYSYECLVATA